jgi:hypothetical protein
VALLDWWDLDRSVPAADARKDVEVDVGGMMLRATPSKRPKVHGGDEQGHVGDQDGGIYWGHETMSASVSGMGAAKPKLNGLLSSFRSEAGAVGAHLPRSTMPDPGPSAASSAAPAAHKPPLILPPRRAKEKKQGKVSALPPLTVAASSATAAASHEDPSVSAAAASVKHSLGKAGKAAADRIRLQKPQPKAAIENHSPAAEVHQQQSAPVLQRPGAAAAHVDAAGLEQSKPHRTGAMSAKIVEEAYKRAASIAEEADSLHAKSRRGQGGLAGLRSAGGGQAQEVDENRAALEHTSKSLAKLSAALMSPTFHPSKKTFKVIAKELAQVSSGLARQEAQQAQST